MKGLAVVSKKRGVVKQQQQQIVYTT